MRYYNEIIMPDSRVNPFIMFAQRSGMISIDKNKIALANNCSEGFFLYFALRATIRLHALRLWLRS